MSTPSPAHRARIIGLTGGIATGKSFVAGFFSDKGIPVIDADQLARDVVRPGSPALDQITGQFGTEILERDGTLNRKKLGGIIFGSPDKRRTLEAILHPAIKALAEARITHHSAEGCPVIVYMAPLLIEAGATDRVDEIWVVTVRPEVQRARLMAREQLSNEEAERMVASQMPLAEKAQYGRVVIDNSGTETETMKILETVWSEQTGRLHG